MAEKYDGLDKTQTARLQGYERETVTPATQLLGFGCKQLEKLEKLASQQIIPKDQAVSPESVKKTRTFTEKLGKQLNSLLTDLKEAYKNNNLILDILQNEQTLRLDLETTVEEIEEELDTEITANADLSKKYASEQVLRETADVKCATEQEAHEATQKVLAETQKSLAQKVKTYEKLDKQYNEVAENHDLLLGENNDLERKLKRTESTITGLAKSRDGWKQKVDEHKESIRTLGRKIKETRAEHASSLAELTEQYKLDLSEEQDAHEATRVQAETNLANKIATYEANLVSLTTAHKLEADKLYAAKLAVEAQRDQANSINAAYELAVKTVLIDYFNVPVGELRAIPEHNTSEALCNRLSQEVMKRAQFLEGLNTNVETELETIVGKEASSTKKKKRK
ncbi:hypothetical protein COV11_00545 [Candidatus Woesearchaeota archaeon CG10_big_fil_rev_8_21_14_0_10_30_7]|nr:MAG: hypothetical protein COV11_00545 [Candidatus Woesearchaeota archaeon CG10_big_fil_rev_8_21_14_0_10_30_7]